MFSFIKKYAAGIVGVDIFPDIALAIFVAVFAAMLWFALRAEKQYIKELEQIPFDN